MDNKQKLIEEMIIPDRVDDWWETPAVKKEDLISEKIISFEYEAECRRKADSVPVAEFDQLFEKI